MKTTKQVVKEKFAKGEGISADMIFENLFIGNVKIHNRIFTNDQVLRLEKEKFKITPLQGKTASAQVDGISYTGGEILVDNKNVYVDGVIKTIDTSENKQVSQLVLPCVEKSSSHSVVQNALQQNPTVPLTHKGTSVMIGGREQQIDRNGEVRRETFTVGKKPLISEGVVNESVTINTNFNGAAELSGTPNEVLALLKRMNR